MPTAADAAVTSFFASLLLSGTIYVQPYGDLPAAHVDAVKHAITSFYDVRVEALPSRPLPKAAYYPPRQRYRADKLLDDLRAHAPEDALRILGLTDVDISTTSGKYPDWGVLGLGDLDGKASVISIFRCRKKAKNTAHAVERLAKVAVHEVGHTLSLDHCPSKGCLMEDAEGLVVTVDGEHDLCSACRAKLRANGVTLSADPSPWR